MRTPEFIRFAKRTGWRVKITKGGHLRLLHPSCPKPLFAALTPSDSRSRKNELARMRRALRPARPA